MKRLLLVGAGHSHVEVVRRLASNRPRNAEIVLVSPERYTPYSGMLPGLLAGHYAFRDCHIDVEQLSRAAGVRFVRAAVSALELERRLARCAGNEAEPFDLLSLDVGSTPDMSSIKELPERVIGAKPVAGLLTAWEKILASARVAPLRIAVVGGGAGGVELALAIRHRLRKLETGTRVDLVTDTTTILPSHTGAVRRRFEGALAESAVPLHCGSRVTDVETGGLILATGERVAADWIIWATSASAPAWLAASGLATDERGFVRVDERLRSPSHPCVFAAGDCASLPGRAVPKAGVYAVRQGPVLAENLCFALDDGPLSRYAPQRLALALISTGGRHAVASWGPVAFDGDWVWRWKDRIDRRFMARYLAPDAAG